MPSPRLPVVGADGGAWGGILNTYLSVSLNSDGTLDATAVRNVNSISTNTTASTSDSSIDYIYFVSGTTTLTLPTAVGNTCLYRVKNTGSNTVTINTTSSQTIDGSLTATLPVANTSLDMISDGSNWRII